MLTLSFLDPVINFVLPWWDKLLGLFKPPSPEVLYNSARDLYQQGQYKKSLQKLDRALKVRPDWAVLPYAKGLCFDKMDQVEAAKQAFKDCLTLTPDDSDCLYNLARLYYEDNSLDVASAYAEQAEMMAEGEGDPQVSYLLGVIYEQQERIEDAVAAYQKSLALNPKQPNVYIYLAGIFMRIHDYISAIETYKTLIEHDPSNSQAMFELAQCFAKTSDWENAIAFCQLVIQLDPKNTLAYNQMGLALYCLGRIEEAIHHYSKALEINPNYATAINNLAYAFEKKGDYVKAIDRFKQYLNHMQDNPAEKVEIEEHITMLQQKV